MDVQAKATEDTVQQLHEYPRPALKDWRNIAILNHFNCFAVSETRKSDEKRAYLRVEGLPKKRIKGGWKTMPYIIGNESCEKLAVVGLHANMIVYLTTKYNMHKVAAVNALTIWSGTTSFASLGGAFLADSYIGRFRTILIGSLSYLLGMALLTLTALVSPLRPSHCSALQKKSNNCQSASKEQLLLLAVVLLFMSIGSAGIKPCIMTFGADQFQQGEEEGTKRKKRLQSFFNWYYFSSTVALIMATTVIVYIQSNVSWSLGFGICTLLMLISIVVFVVGAPIFRYEVLQGSPFTRFAQVIVASIRKRNLPLPPHPALIYYGQSSSNIPVTDRFRFLNKAAITTEGDIQEDGSVAKPWRLSPIQQIEELKSIIATLPIFSCLMANAITVAQRHTFSVLQALTMNRNLGSTTFQVPAGSFSVFSSLVVITWLPFYDRMVVPLARRTTKQVWGITALQRMGIGFAVSSISMLVAGFVEIKRRNAARSHGLTDDPSAVVPISAFWLLPQLCITGLADAFHTVGYLEFFYGQFPPSLRSTAIALSSCTYALGSYLSTMIVAVIHSSTGRNGKPDWLDDNLNRSRLENFYWLMSAMEALNVGYFLVCASWYKYKDYPVADGSQKSDVSDHQDPYEI